MGVVTSKGNMMMERGLKFIGADDYIEVAIGYDSVHIHKPDPYPVKAALEKLEYGADEAVFVGDSPHDIKSGNAAGVITIAALWGPFTRSALEPYKPTYFLDDIKHLPALLDRIAVKSAG
jgi:pyrophosphatase PpaX